MVNCAAVLLFIEISTHFVVFRWILFEHGIKGGHTIFGVNLHAVNSVLLLVTFILGRVFFQLFVFICYGAPFLVEVFTVQKDVPQFFMVTDIMFLLSFILNCCLNFYWAWLIIKQVYRMITRGTKSDEEYSPDTDKG